MLIQSSRVVPAALLAITLVTSSGQVLSAAEADAPPDKPKAEEGTNGGAQPDVAPRTKPTADEQKNAPERTRKRIWADSMLYCDAPKLEMSTWLTEKPEIEGKFVLIEFWRTWCGACKRTVPLLNSFHEKYGKELAVIAVTGESAETVKAYAGPKMTYSMAIDAPGTKREADAGVIKDQGAVEKAFGVWGWPHVVLLEPEHHCVIWEGFPLLKGHELTAEIIEKALAIGRNDKAAK
jgi:thiol-disulfide isomerase/thioredoxin